MNTTILNLTLNTTFQEKINLTTETHPIGIAIEQTLGIQLTTLKIIGLILAIAGTYLLIEKNKE